MALHHKSDLMELRGQDNLSHKVSSTTVGERRDQTGHGKTIFNPSPALDHHHQNHHHLYHQPSNPETHQNTDKPRRDPDPNPDPVPAPIAASGATIIINRAAAAPKVRYRECLKNHAASMGGHVVDGCGEFMSGGEEGTPEALKCAACECHRNFHRKEVEGDHYVSNRNNNNSGRGDQIVPPRQYPPPPPPPHLHHHHHKFPHGVSASPSAGHVVPVMMAFGAAAAEYSSSEDLNMFRSNVGVQTSEQAPESKKRFRTRFSREQKDKMMEFADKLGWKIQKHDEQQVHHFCSEVGVKKQVFKVWMHNNKQTMKNKQI
ncbi:zinc-finger homeodomain protein 5 [Corylus avellana]|uniref:zinc-finger homeodomain protein 5 n=1 Tax=Corylus avellana TaxID=13451 RepID=UPI00286B01D5|nr:zinc-finger homeodomain protein 5 [Corylus avellana]